MNDFKYEVADGKVTITRYKGIGGDVVIPDTIDGRPVTIIGAYAFLGCFKLTNITLPNSITTIGDWAFARCFFLTSVTMLDSLINIGEGAFEDCPEAFVIRKKEAE